MTTRILLIGALLLSGCSGKRSAESPLNFSGIYPHLAYYNNEAECGTGAVVPWADRLWVITYGPHLPLGSSDKLYEINPELQLTAREESIGGTPANRMIHRESNQLFIGPYAIDAKRNVRVIPYESMPGRHTGNARHLFEPAGKIYYGTMEEGFYEVDVNTLKVNTLYKDGNVVRKEGQMAQENLMLLGAHGKGLYSGQGVVVYSNNGETGQAALERFDIESGALYEWDGYDWELVRRNQFVEVTGPGGIYGNTNPKTDPIWTTGWDHKSVLVGVRNPLTGWDFYRLPKASSSYDGAHGWNTEWPRIRNIGTGENPDYLMTMHGMFWRFPGNFTSLNSTGIRPRSAYLKVIGDFTRWNDHLVFGCDDSAQREFLNKRKAKGDIEGPGQSNSNLWFTPVKQPDLLGPVTASGSVWLDEEINANEVSEPFLFAGWKKRSAWILNEGKQPVDFTFEVDANGAGKWTSLERITLPAGSSAVVPFEENTSAEWIRVVAGSNTKATVHFTYADEDERTNRADPVFIGLSEVGEVVSTGGLLYGLGDDRRALGIAVNKINGFDSESTGYYELNGDMKLVKKNDEETHSFIKEKFVIPKDAVTIDEASVLIVDDKGRRWRLPMGHKEFTGLTAAGVLRICREVATERDMFNCHGTFYELPAENADGYAKIRPIASHNFQINDYALYRGMLIITGLNTRSGKKNPHIIISDDGQAAVWAGVIDDLWKMGKPTGKGGPWKNSAVKEGEPSDPYLFGFYDKRKLSLSHTVAGPVSFMVQFQPVGHGPWMTWEVFTVAPGETFSYEFPRWLEARWIRFIASRDCTATAWLVYD
ncbi:MAG: hypothetical protein R6X09_04865 [Bacteroidales bacterium]